MSGAPHSKADQLARGPKRPARIKANLREWDILRERKLGPCRVADQSCSGRIELHHLIARSWLGGDVADNLVSLCSRHHGQVTSHEKDARQRLAESLTDAEYAYIVEKLGEGGMERLFGVFGRVAGEGETPE